MSEMLLAIGTRKGLFLARRDEPRAAWRLSEPDFLMNAVYAVAIDTRGPTPRLLVGADSSHWGPSVFASNDLGETWSEPEEGSIAFPADADASLARVWALQPSAAEPGVVWAGAEPSALFRSEDGGVHYELVRALWDHPHRPQWGAGFGGQAIHTVLPHPTDAQQIVVAMSTGGVYRTEDGGNSWSPANAGIKAYFLPDPWPEFGQCVHKVARDSGDPERLYLQNHHGVYRSDDGGRQWSSIADTLPSDFGFTMVADPHRAGVAYNFPIVADGERIPPEHACRVYRTDDAGDTWAPVSGGLPQSDYYGVVLRDAMCVDDASPAGVYFGTRNGEVYASAEEGHDWSLVAAHLPDVLCVRAAAVG